MHTGVGGTVEGKNRLEDPGIDTIILKQNLKKRDEKAWTGLIWHRTGTNGGLL